jgi:hypothetical protein
MQWLMLHFLPPKGGHFYPAKTHRLAEFTQTAKSHQAAKETRPKYIVSNSTDREKTGYSEFITETQWTSI